MYLNVKRIDFLKILELSDEKYTGLITVKQLRSALTVLDCSLNEAEI